jgi:glycosyltransferase involved in cell wall biosynthesis
MVRILLLTMECLPHFSGNGTLSQSVVRALKSQGHLVMVVCGAPQNDATVACNVVMPFASGAEQLTAANTAAPVSATSSHGDNAINAPIRDVGDCSIMRVPLSVFRLLNRQSAHVEFADSVGKNVVADAVKAFAADVVVGVDWTSVAPFEKLRDAGAVSRDIKYIYYNFSVFHRHSNASLDDRAFYLARERCACRLAARILCLNSADADVLRALLLPRVDVTANADDVDISADVAANVVDDISNDVAVNVDDNISNDVQTVIEKNESVDVCVLLCPLRRQIELLARASIRNSVGGAISDDKNALTSSTSPIATRTTTTTTTTMTTTADSSASTTVVARAPRREFISCVCRLSQEKRVHVFVDLCTALAPHLRRLRLRPFLCGAEADKAYAADVKSKLSDACPDAVFADFLSADELADVFRRSVVNVHPPLCT